MKPTCFGFDWWGISPCLVLWRGACPGWLSPSNCDPGSTHILIWYYGAQSHTNSHLESSGTMPTSKFLQLSPSGLFKHLRMGSVQTPHHILITQMELHGFIKVVNVKIM
jgi:hypothetical protein